MNYELSKVKETMTSVEIAELINKPHNDVMKAIRAMEPAWEKVCKGKFSLTSRDVVQPNGGKRSVPCYELGKTECIFIATKFNDEARAMIILRWEQLEKEKAQSMPAVPTTFREALLLAAEQQAQIEEQQKEIETNKSYIEYQERLIEESQGRAEALAEYTKEQNKVIDNQSENIRILTSAVQSMERKVSYVEQILSCKSTVKVKVIAQDYGMSAIAFNQLLHTMGIQYKEGESWFLYRRYISEGYVKDIPVRIVGRSGERMKSNMQWTQRGRMFLYEFLKSNGILPLIEQ